MLTYFVTIRRIINLTLSKRTQFFYLSVIALTRTNTGHFILNMDNTQWFIMSESDGEESDS